MNMRAVFTVAVLLSFAAGFMSAESLIHHTGMENNIIVSNNTKIMVLNDRQYYPVVLKEIKSANKSIHIVMFEMVWYGNPDEDSHDVSILGRELASAAKRHVDVRVILENGWSYGGFEYQKLVGYVKNWTTYFRAHGVKIEHDWSNQTTHDKLVIIDGTTVIVGSTNWSQSALKYNHEANALIENRDVAREYEDYFNALWNDYAS